MTVASVGKRRCGDDSREKLRCYEMPKVDFSIQEVPVMLVADAMRLAGRLAERVLDPVTCLWTTLLNLITQLVRSTSPRRIFIV